MIHLMSHAQYTWSSFYIIFIKKYQANGIMINRDYCTYQKEGNEDEKFCFAPSTRYASTCLDIGEGNLYHFCEPDCLCITADLS